MESLDNASDRTWALAALGSVIGAYVDREVNKPQVIDNGGGYGIDDQGRMYALGQPTGGYMDPPQRPINTTLVLLILGAAFIASRQ